MNRFARASPARTGLIPDGLRTLGTGKVVQIRRLSRSLYEDRRFVVCFRRTQKVIRFSTRFRIGSLTTSNWSRESIAAYERDRTSVETMTSS